MNTPFQVTDKVILITGAYGLIGKGITKAFLEQGALVAACDIDTSRRDEALAQWHNFTDGKHFITCTTDITDLTSCAHTVQEVVKSFGKIDVLINNAAIDAKFEANTQSDLQLTRFEHFPIAQLQKSLDVNVTGLVQITQAVVQQMLRQGYGNIINVASTYSLVSPNQNLYDYGEARQQYKPVDYVITKSMVPNFTKYLATFYAMQGIRCNAIAPHGIMHGHGEQFVQNFSKLSPMGRMSELDEVTGPFLFLASDASSYMTGSILTVDGGWTAW